MMLPHRLYPFLINYVLLRLQWFVQTTHYLDNHQSATNEYRVWSAGIVMALVIIMKRTGIRSVFNINAFRIMFTCLCLEKNQCEHLVGLMDNSLRSVIC